MFVAVFCIYIQYFLLVYIYAKVRKHVYKLCLMNATASNSLYKSYYISLIIS